jgi:hypothetical protein
MARDELSRVRLPLTLDLSNHKRHDAPTRAIKGAGDMRRGGAWATALAVVAVVLISVPSAGAWTSNFWRSPTGNIACRYYPNLETVTCQTDNDHYSLAVDRYGLKAYRSGYRWIPSWAPTLAYGLHWTAPGFNCLSRFDGMLCHTPAGHGFFLSREKAETW